MKCKNCGRESGAKPYCKICEPIAAPHGLRGTVMPKGYKLPKGSDIFDGSMESSVRCEQFEAEYVNKPEDRDALVNCFVGRIIQQKNWENLISKFPKNDLDGSVLDKLYGWAWVPEKIVKVKEAYTLLFKKRPGYIKGLVLNAEDPEDTEGGDASRFRWAENFVCREDLFGYLDAGILLGKDMSKEFPWNAELYLFAKYLMEKEDWHSAWLLLEKLTLLLEEPEDLQKWLSEYECESGSTLSKKDKEPSVVVLAKIAFEKYIENTDIDQLYEEMSFRIKELLAVDSEIRRHTERAKKLEKLIKTWSKIFKNQQEGYAAWLYLKKEIRVQGVEIQEVTKSLDLMRAFYLLRDMEARLRGFLVANLKESYGEKRDAWKDGIPEDIQMRVAAHGNYDSIDGFFSNMEFGMYDYVIKHNYEKIFAKVFKKNALLTGNRANPKAILRSARVFRNQFYHINNSSEDTSEKIEQCYNDFIALYQ